MHFAKNTCTTGNYTALFDQLPAFHEHGFLIEGIQREDSKLKVVILFETLPTSMAPNPICMSSALP
jgi:hypothetical protein